MDLSTLNIKALIFVQINKHTRHVFYLQFTINVFQTYLLISVTEVIFYDYL